MGTTINLNDITPAAPLGRTNVKWQADTQNPRNVSASIATPSFAGLSDVTLSGLSIGQIATYNGSKWVNGSGPLTTAGDIIYENATPALARLPIGTAGQTLTVVSGLPAWAASATSVLTTAGDTLYENATPALARLPIGTAGQVLTVGVGGLPAWTNGAQATLTTAGDLLYENATPALARLPIGTAGQVLTVSVGGFPAWQAAGGGGDGGIGSLVGARKTAYHYLSGSAPPAQIQDSGTAIGGAFGAASPTSSSRQAAAYWYQSTGVATPAGYQSSTNATFIPWWFDGANLSTFVSCFLVQTVTERAWIGMFDTTLSTATIFGSDSPGTKQYVAFRYSTVAGDTQFQCCTCDGTTQTTVSSGVNVDTKTHSFVIVCNDSVPNVKFYIDGILVATITTNTPTTSLAYAYLVVGLTSTAAVTSKIGFTQAIIQQDF